ncbi:nitrous oxide reductase accessory protein NosL [Brevibacillus marinus]|uniref:nitrous oxide reductase accessory protein NosL n=1 Tax=Brevibacillus marinus TaxID=2496837 RepID=UPI001F496494|nr:nitrous oxide reductase accessory protein NosL [Brevibacillus marinus]
MKPLKLAFAGLLGLVILLAGCGAKEAQPAAIVEGVDKCEVCHMHVHDDHNATQIVLQDGKTLKFDDIGCMHRWTEENGAEQVQAQFVRDYLSREWIRYEQATYAYDPSYPTPMGYGIYSFQDQAAAEAFVQEQGTGTVMSAQELANHTWTSSMKKHQGEHGSMQHGTNQQNTGHGHGSAEGHGTAEAHGSAEGHGSAEEQGSADKHMPAQGHEPAAQHAPASSSTQN